MKLLTEVGIKELGRKITYNDKILSIGSCFAVNMSTKLQSFQFQVHTNPFGILFHPIAIKNMLQYAIQEKEFTLDEVFCNQEIWSSFEAHSDLNALEAQDIVDALNAAIMQLRKSLKESNFCILTFGTAWVYEHVSTQRVVANCHKMDGKLFNKRMLSYQEVLENFQETLNLVRHYNKDIQVITTLSPVRHSKDGFVENQASKSLLHFALQQVVGEYSQGVSYFPSYEIMMDELRDYRFYGADLLHPNAIAIDYIWEKFVRFCIDQDCHAVMKKVDQVQKGLGHIPFNPTARQHLEFLDSLISKIDELLDQYPFMNFR
ncbi:GSCFA domain-containing protein [Myroides sp. LJL116]